METEVNNDYIEKALTELISVLGTKEYIDHQKLISLIQSKKIKEAIKAIALYLGLPVEVNLSYVPKGYRPSSNARSNDGFQSTHLVKTNRRGRGTSSITAQVSIPSNLPMYGTRGMFNFPINVRVSENCAENPAILITVMAHELSHILLHSLFHKEKENEFYTDLTAMLLGFAKITKIGRKVVKTRTSTESGFFSSTTTTYTETTEYGYLSDENFHFAFQKIVDELNKHKYAKDMFFKKLSKCKKKLKKKKRLSLFFSKYLEYLDKNLNHKISQEDGHKISVFHQRGHTDTFQSVVRKYEANLDAFSKFVENLRNYTGRNIEIMQQYETQLKSGYEELEKQHFILQQDVDILKKYVGLFYKLKLKFS